MVHLEPFDHHAVPKVPFLASHAGALMFDRLRTAIATSYSIATRTEGAYEDERTKRHRGLETTLPHDGKKSDAHLRGA
jgi:hypothetical protein